MSGLGLLAKLISDLGRLPGVGRRSAERMALRLVHDRELLRELIQSLRDAAERVQACSRCGAITASGENPCRLCADTKRDGSVLCVVEDPDDILIIERSGSFRGRYHSLMGKISPMEGQGPDDIRVVALLKRVNEERFAEVVLALNTDVESDATAQYIAEAMKLRGVSVSRLAFGLPAGSGIRYSDPITLSRAMKGRQAL